MYRVDKRVLVIVALCATFSLVTTVVLAGFGGGFRGSAVGGVSIDAEGVLSNPQLTDQQAMMEAWQSGNHVVPQELKRASELRFVSLRGIEAALAKAAAEQTPVPDEVKYMAGLTRVEYVLVYPERGDIVLAGRAEPWKIDKYSNLVGEKSGEAVLMLDDFMVALRAARENLGRGMTCSIDPTAEGLQRVQQISGRLNANAGPQAAARQIEQALGYQTITVTGIPATSHFARTIVAADFRMKRIAMNFEKAPVPGMPSFLQMVGARGAENLLPRWWMAPNYEAIVRDEQGLAWQLKGQGVKCMTEDDYVAEDGTRTQTGKSGGTAQKWADKFTENFESLALADSTFCQLRNVMDLAVVTTLIEQQGMADKVGLEMPYLTGKEEIEEFNAPTRVASKASFIKKGGNWIISASGGVQIDPGSAIAKQETANLPALGKGSATASEQAWWWDAG